MPTKIEIDAAGVSMTAELDDSKTSQSIIDALPIEGSVNRWGEEIYFSIPVDIGLEDGARADMEVGELGYWPTGKAFCIFFGPTPASGGDNKPVAASEVNVLGKVDGDATEFSSVKGGEKITLKKT